MMHAHVHESWPEELMYTTRQNVSQVLLIWRWNSRMSAKL